MHACMYVYVCMRACVRVYVRMHVRVYVHMHVRVHVHVCRSHMNIFIKIATMNIQRMFCISTTDSKTQLQLPTVLTEN